MLFDKLIAGQLHHPGGALAGLTALNMNRTNTNINKTTVQLLDIKPSDRVLEIGFGGGEALNEIAKLAGNGLVAGIDVSDSMLKRGAKRFAALISEKKMELKAGSSAKIPYPDSFFDKVCAINCIYFWDNPVADLKEVKRIMKNGGKLIISVYNKEQFKEHSFTKYGFSLYSDGQLENLLGNAGFNDIHLEHRAGNPIEAIFAISVKK
jgi:arsenite methyltransferase